MTAPVVHLRDVVVPRRRHDLHVDELAIGPGITAVLGANASGKSTLLRVIATVQRYVSTSGLATVGGHDLATESGRHAVRSVLGYAPQDDSVPGRMRVFDHVDVVAVFRGLGAERPRRGAVAAALDAVDVAHLAGERAGRLSGGERRRVALAAAIVGSPRLLVLDEPDTHLDDAHRSALTALLRAMTATTTIVVATHDRRLVDELGARTVLVDRGHVSR